MLSFLAHMMRTKLPRLSRYLEMYLATSCDLTPSQDPGAPTSVGYEQPRAPPASSCGQPPSRGRQDQGYRTDPRHPPPRSTPPTGEQAANSFNPRMSSPQAPTHRTRDTGHVHSFLLPTLPSSQLQASRGQSQQYQAVPISHGPQDEIRPAGKATALRTSPPPRPPQPSRNQKRATSYP